ncbi:MAG: chemotaxis protein methyltransferase CheR [Chthoniobacter sp.]|jgi:chemotaxis protein methyltransferase CheR|nr:chemotaxis protein methyltransferase CheR [Chthoniobacter sp.]
MSEEAEIWGTLSRIVGEQTGLGFPDERERDVRRAVAAAGQELELDSPTSAAEYFIEHQADKKAIELLAKHFTVGETYFFRDPAAFRRLEFEILPPIIEVRRESSRCLRLWSAGCCTGEEPYSLAMLLARMLPDLERWNITILATDLNPDFLQKAEKGEYSKWSFRGTPDSVRSSCFRRTSEGKFTILPIYKTLVSFGILNLISDLYPSPFNNTSAMDIILCRNVLMYFTPDQAAKVAGALGNSLIEGGWLIGSAVEAGPAFASLTPVMFPDAIVYRKLSAPPPPAQEEAQPSAPTWRAPKEGPRDDPAEARPAAEDLAKEARSKADRGCFEDALACCEKALSIDTHEPSLHYLKAMILQEMNHLEEAAASLRETVYLDPAFVSAYFALGMIMHRREDRLAAAKYFETARGILQSYRPEEIVPHSAGVTARRLTQIIETTKLQAK